MTQNNQTSLAKQIKTRVFKIDFDSNYKLESDGFWHCEGNEQKDVTLCGHALDDECEVKSKIGKITCPHCLDIIEFCKSLIEKRIREDVIEEAKEALHGSYYGDMNKILNSLK